MGVVISPLPNAVSAAGIRDAETRRAVMLLMEDIRELKRQLEEAQREILRLRMRAES